MKRPWTLREGTRIVAEIVVDDGDFPWLHGPLTALPGFEEYAPLFAEELRLIQDPDRDDDAWGAVYGQISEALTLYDDDGAEMADFLMHIEDGRARWRFQAIEDED